MANICLAIHSLQTDSMLSLEKERDYKNEHFDFLQQQIRRFCLKCILLKVASALYLIECLSFIVYGIHVVNIWHETCVCISYECCNYLA
jgi:hypothetical protein